MAMQFVAEVSAIAKGSMKAFEVGGEKVLLVHLDDGIHAIQSKCTHLGMPLEKGRLVDGCRVQCKFHRAQFDIRTGKVCEWANFPPGIQMLNFLRGERDLKTYPVQLEADKIYVDV